MQRKKEIVERFFQKGKLLTPDALEFLASSKDYEKMLDSVDNITGKMIIEKEDFINFETAKDRIRIIKNLSSAPSELSPNIFSRSLMSKFEKMKKIFVERMGRDFISLDKIDNSRQEVSVIGLAREIETEENRLIIELEDATKTMQAVFSNYTPKVPVHEDDVIVVVGTGSREMIFGKEIMYPDIPLREPTKGFGKICAISDLHLNEAPTGRLIKFMQWLGSQEDIKYLFVLGDIVDTKKFNEIIMQNVPEKTVFIIPGNVDSRSYPGLPIEISNSPAISLSNPSIVEVNGIKILLIHDFDINYIKKRYLGKSTLVLEEDYLALDEVPDIVLCGHTHEPSVINYKSVTIANPGSLLGEFSPVVVDLATREYKQMSFE